jgi:predicted nuclease with TOPRIM domain
MPTKREPPVADLTVRILREIRDDVREVRDEAKKTNDELKKTNERLDALRVEMHDGFDALRAEMHDGFELLGRRVDNVLLGEHRREHEDLRGRVERIEQHLGLPY